MATSMHTPNPQLKQHLQVQLDGAMRAISSLAAMLPSITIAAELLVETLQQGGKVLTAGNGGSAAEAMHMAEELTGRYKGNRPSFPGIALTADGTALTCIANDFGFDAVFSRQIEGLGRSGDLLVLFSTSGQAVNLRRAVDQARLQRMRVLSLLGRTGGALAGLSDVELLVSCDRTEHVQEAHQVILHLLLDAVEQSCHSTSGDPCG